MGMVAGLPQADDRIGLKRAPPPNNERKDPMSLTANGFQLARRSILVDQVVLGMPNFAIFL